MLFKYWTFCIAIVVAGCKPNNHTKTEPEPDVFGLQKIVVTTENAESTKGTMVLQERATKESEWTTIDTFAILVGRNGMTTNKKEGDGCAPSGVFTLGKVFSYNTITNLLMPFQQVDSNDLCVDDVNSKYYNTLVNNTLINDKDFTSFEYMRRNDHQYEYGVWVNYNTNPQISGNGSCIFLHIYKDPETPTSGCTAMSKADMLKLIYWLDEEKNPMLVQAVIPPAAD